ncbi:MAG: signal peptidase I [Oscillospiraceae bacterium]|nr:signal peptidase I [Oscillospiraceae bacterium]
MNTWKKLLKEWILPLGAEVLVIVFLLKVVFMLVLVPSGSMLPTIQRNSVLFCTYIHDISKVQRGEILVFESDELGKTLIKRLIGLPGETVTIQKDGSVAVDGQTIDEAYVIYPKMDEELSFEIPEGQYLFLGDNRAGSEDARCWDEPFIPAEKIKARARFTLWPLDHFGGLK